MPIYRKPSINTSNIAPTVVSIYSYRTSRTDAAKNISQKHKLYSTFSNKNYGDKYDFPVNYPSVSTMQNSMINVGTNLGTIPF